MPESSKPARRRHSQPVLRYVLDDSPGYTRRPYRSGFHFFNSQGKPIRDASTLARLDRMRIPPAWVDVWICPFATGHLQATGRDQRGRKQYLYHESWTAQQSVLKYERILEFAAFLPRIRRRVARDLSRRNLPKEKVLAAIVRLMELTSIRVGNEEYVHQNGSYGLTTLRDHHARVRGKELHLRFCGKSGKWSECDVRDERLARIVRRCQELPGQQLLQYLDTESQVHDITSADVNEYLRAITGRDFSAKDFRTWSATALAVSLLRRACEKSAGPTKRQVVEVIDCIAQRLNNTRTVCRKSYIHPGVIESFLDRSLAAYCRSARPRMRRVPAGMTKQESLALEVLRALAQRNGA